MHVVLCLRREAGNGPAVDNGLVGCGVDNAWVDRRPVAPAQSVSDRLVGLMPYTMVSTMPKSLTQLTQPHLASRHP